MTDAQQQAIDKAQAIVSEHFDDAIIVVGYREDDPKGGQFYNTAGCWHGGVAAAIGLCHIHNRRLLNGHVDQDEVAT